MFTPNTSLYRVSTSSGRNTLSHSPRLRLMLRFAQEESAVTEVPAVKVTPPHDSLQLQGKVPPGKLYEPLAPFAHKLHIESSKSLTTEFSTGKFSQKPLWDFLRNHQHALAEPVAKLAEQARSKEVAQASGLKAGLFHAVAQHELGHALLATLVGCSPWMIAGVQAPFGVLPSAVSGQVFPLLGDVHAASPHAAKGVLMMTLAGLAFSHELKAGQVMLRPNLLEQLDSTEQGWVCEQFIKGALVDFANFNERYKKFSETRLIPPMPPEEQARIKDLPIPRKREGAVLSPQETYLLDKAQAQWVAEIAQLPTAKKYLMAASALLNKVPPETMTAMGKEVHQRGLLYGTRTIEDFFEKHLGREALTALRQEHAKVVADLSQ